MSGGGRREIVRRGWPRNCPACGGRVTYTVFSNHRPTPFFYSDAANDILLRKSDMARVHELCHGGQPATPALEALWIEILRSAPKPPHGGTFTLWANVRCPRCDTEFPYNRGVRDVSVRILDPKIIVMDGATVMDDDGPYRVAVELSR